MAIPATSALLRPRARQVRGIECREQWTSAFAFFNRPRAVTTAVSLFDIVAALEARICFERVGLRNPRTGLASDGVVTTRDRHERATFERRGFGESYVRDFTCLAGERKIFAQRKIRIAFPHQDAAQVGVTAKANTHHVVDFALVPI